MKNKNKTMIRMTKNTAEILKNIGTMNETYESLILRLVDFYLKNTSNFKNKKLTGYNKKLEGTE